VADGERKDDVTAPRREDQTLATRIAAAHVYDTLFVPAEFEVWAPRVASAGRVGPGSRVLDVACGTGVLSREAARRVGPTGSVTGIDLDPGMLAVAARRASGIAWYEGRAESLPFPDRSFDAVLCQFGLMYFSDRAAALREMYRVAAPGGHIVLAVWDSLDQTPAYAAFVRLLARVIGPRAADALRAPFVLGDRDELAAIVTAAGLRITDIETHHATTTFPGIRPMVEAELRGWMPIAGIELSPGDIDCVLDEARREFRPYLRPNGRVEFDSPAHVVTCVKGRMKR
jgi:ubiquinone/menaquinone biosynthesis C-methylase UbiE